MYEIHLQKNTVKRNQVTAIHLIAAFLLIVMGFISLVTPFSLNIYNAGKENTAEIPYTWANYAGILLMITGIAIIIISIFFNKKMIQHQKNLIIRSIEILCFGAILAYCLYHRWTLPAIYAGGALVAILLAYFIEKANMKSSKILIDEQHISLITGIKASHWKWSEINRIIIKHNVVTIDTLEDKRYQFIVSTEHSIPSQEIMKYADAAILKAVPDRIKDNW